MGVTQLGLDAAEQCLTAAKKQLRDCIRFETDNFSDALHALVFEVAKLNHLTLSVRELFETGFEKPLPSLKGGLLFFGAYRKGFGELIGKRHSIALPFLSVPVLQDLVARNLKSPGTEVGSQLKGFRFPPENPIRVLKNVVHLTTGPNQ